MQIKFHTPSTEQSELPENGCPGFMGEHTLFAACRRERTFLSREFSRFPQITQAASDTHAHAAPGVGGDPRRSGRWSPILSLYSSPRLPSLGSKSTRMAQITVERKPEDRQGLGTHAHIHPGACSPGPPVRSQGAPSSEGYPVPSPVEGCVSC